MDYRDDDTTRRRRLDEGGGYAGGGGDRGGYRRSSGGGGSGDRRSSFNSSKRPRDDGPSVDDDPDRALLASIFKVADLPRPPSAPPPDVELSALAASLLRGDASTRPAAVVSNLTDCATALAPKAPWYAALAGLLNAGDESLGRSLAEAASARLSDAVAGRGDATAACSRSGVRLAARWVAALAGAGVVVPADAVAALRALVDGAAAAAAAAAGDADASHHGRTWQPWADALVSAALAALPWGGAELASAAASDVDALLAAAARYVASRPRQASAPGLSLLWPDLACPPPPSDAAASPPSIDAPPEACDSGGASNLAILQSAVEAWWAASAGARAGGGGGARALAALLPSLPAPAAAAPGLEAGLAAGRPHALAPPAVPPAPPAASALPPGTPPDVVAAAVLAAHPPVGRAGLLPPATMGVGTAGPAALDWLIAESYVVDTLRAFDGDRVALARRLAHGLPLGPPLPADAPAERGGDGPAAAAPHSPRPEPLLASTLFSQLLSAPAAELPPLAYCAAMVDLCKLLPAGFPRAMSACVRECFARLGAPMDPELAARLRSWLSYHLSNFDFMWPWARWAAVLEAPPHDPARRFVGGLLDGLVRLSYRARLVGVLPEGGYVDDLLPPEPAIAPASPLPPGTDWAGGAGLEPAVVRAAAANEVAQLVRRKAGDEALTAWAAAPPPSAAAALAATAPSGPAALLAALVHGLLVAGAKSFTHMTTALERHGAVVKALAASVDAAGGDGGLVTVTAAADAWAACPARAAQAVDRLLTLGLATPGDAVRWALTPPAVDFDGSALPSGFTPPPPPFFALGDGAAARAGAAGWEILHAAAAAAVEEAASSGEAGRGSTAVLAATPADLTLALTLMRDALAAGPSGTSSDPSIAAWRSRSLAALRGFTRLHYRALAAGAAGLRTEVFGPGAAPEDVRAAVLPALEL